jgi:hypothetical protein
MVTISIIQQNTFVYASFFWFPKHPSNAVITVNTIFSRLEFWDGKHTNREGSYIVITARDGNAVRYYSKYLLKKFVLAEKVQRTINLILSASL